MFQIRSLSPKAVQAFPLLNMSVEWHSISFCLPHCLWFLHQFEPLCCFSQYLTTFQNHVLASVRMIGIERVDHKTLEKSRKRWKVIFKWSKCTVLILNDVSDETTSEFCIQFRCKQFLLFLDGCGSTRRGGIDLYSKIAMESVWPEENRQMSIKITQKWFH